jgi:molecular chaperone DnaK (HSP70)
MWQADGLFNTKTSVYLQDSSCGENSIEDGICEDKSIEGAPFGTDDFVSNLVEYVLANPFNVNLPASPDRQMLGEAYRAATERLCHSQATHVEGPSGFIAALTRAQFEEVNEPLFERCLEMATRCIADAHLAINDVLVLGEAGRIPSLKERLVHRFTVAGRYRQTMSEGDCVVRGAAIYAAIMGGERTSASDMLLLQVRDGKQRSKSLQKYLRVPDVDNHSKVMLF